MKNPPRLRAAGCLRVPLHDTFETLWGVDGKAKELVQ